jgi:hypothetical protein
MAPLGALEGFPHTDTEQQKKEKNRPQNGKTQKKKNRRKNAQHRSNAKKKGKRKRMVHKGIMQGWGPAVVQRVVVSTPQTEKGRGRSQVLLN